MNLTCFQRTTVAKPFNQESIHRDIIHSVGPLKKYDASR